MSATPYRFEQVLKFLIPLAVKFLADSLGLARQGRAGRLVAIALDLDTGVLARVSTVATGGLKQKLVDRLSLGAAPLPVEGVLPTLNGAVQWNPLPYQVCKYVDVSVQLAIGGSLCGALKGKAVVHL